jgi:hypothetical protein
MLKIAFDIGGVLSKYPDTFRRLVDKLRSESAPGIPSSVEIYIISDMHDVDMMNNMLLINNINIDKDKIFSADYKNQGEYCKTKLCNELKIDIFIDDFLGYVTEGGYVRLLVMPDVNKPYYDDTWKTDGSEGDFGRRRKPLKP